MNSERPGPVPSRESSGVAGLDLILNGGLPRHRLYLLEGSPGTGKTTLALQFLQAGVAAGQSALYVSLSETRDELEEVAASHGWSLEGIHLFEATEANLGFEPGELYTVLPPEEVELTELIRHIFAAVDRLQPTRVVFDSASDLRLLARDSLRYRRQILAIKQFLSTRKSTTMLLDDLTSNDNDRQLQSIAHGVIRLERYGKEYGASRRFLQVVKMRGVEFLDGSHDYCIRRGGLSVFPRLVAADSRSELPAALFASGVPELDALTGGGLDSGASALVLGPAGAGKSNLATQYLHSALTAGHRAVAYIFEESGARFRKRSAGIGLDITPFEKSGLLTVRQIDPAEVSPGEFFAGIRDAVELNQVRFILLDSLNGYVKAMPNEQFLVPQIHELLSYLNNHGVVTLLTLAQHGLLGKMTSSVDLSYIADTILLLRYFEAEGAVRQALSVMKRRDGVHERTIREFRVTSHGVTIGEPLSQFSGVLTGLPVFSGSGESLMQHRKPSQ